MLSRIGALYHVENVFDQLDVMFCYDPSVFCLLLCPSIVACR